MIKISDFVIARPGGSRLTMEEGIAGWGAQVAHLRGDVRKGPSRDSWGIYDLVGALELRDMIQNALSTLEAGPRTEVERMLAPLDDEYVQYSHPNSDGLTHFAEKLIPADHWWWFRRPVAGPVILELEEWDKRNSR